MKVKELDELLADANHAPGRFSNKAEKVEFCHYIYAETHEELLQKARK